MGKNLAANKEKMLSDFEKLSKGSKKEAIDFIAYLKIRDEVSATKEILEDKDFLQSIFNGEKDFKLGQFKKWSMVKANV
ncbi:MAG: hypothetical protein HZA78_08135 [Candidatus Schekmanbacteria bacterium]|nr:hypothetical protein [Candidatus Schekmanbacteria bacterium]